MKCSNSRSTFPFDKPIPRDLCQRMSTNQKKTLKKMQQSKQRQHDKKLCVKFN